MLEMAMSTCSTIKQSDPNSDDRPAAEARPVKPMYRFSGDAPPPALARLRDKPRWVAWDYVWKAKAGKWDKPPVDPHTGGVARVNDAKTWGTFAEALACMKRFRLAGVGIVLFRGMAGGMSGVDLDDCITDADSLTPLAADVIGYGETYAERSPSGEGLRLFVLGSIPKTLKADGIGVEVYDHGRYLTVTGQHWKGTPTEIREAPHTLARLTTAVDADRERKRETTKHANPNGAHINGHANGHARAGDDFFANVNAIALGNLDRWVPVLHPTAEKKPNGAWRLPAADLGRPDLQEDLSYHPSGISYFGEEITLTAIDAVQRFGNVADVKVAAFWLCQQMGVEPSSLGWKGRASGLRKAEDGELPVLEDWALPNAQEQEISSHSTSVAVPDIKSWPIMESKATHGIVGSIARLATANSEADPVAVIATTLTWAAAEFGRCQFIFIGDDKHHSRHFCGIVGQSSRARKGTSKAPVKRIFEEADKIRRSASTLPFPSGSRLKVSNGPLSSGEGLVYAIRDKSEGDEGNESDKGVEDKRFLCIEGELGAALRAFQRSGNNLSMILRMAFDGERIAPLTKNSRIAASDPHINLLGHITRHELKELLSATEIWNGFGNRILWLCARRPKTVAFPTPMPDDEVTEIATELARVIALAHRHGPTGGRELVMSNAAQDHWVNVYAELTQDHPGVLGAVTSRAEAHARRLALTYAQLDGADRIEIDHLEAALAFVRFAGDCAAYLFGGVELNPIAQKILEALAIGPKTQTEISGSFGRHLRKDQLNDVLSDLQERGRITLTVQKTDGAPVKIWSLVQ
jgi:hypothetical protein